MLPLPSVREERHVPASELGEASVPLRVQHVVPVQARQEHAAAAYGSGPPGTSPGLECVNTLPEGGTLEDHPLGTTLDEQAHR